MRILLCVATPGYNALKEPGPKTLENQEAVAQELLASQSLPSTGTQELDAVRCFGNPE